MAASRRKWTRGERVEVTQHGLGTVVGEHLDGPLVSLDSEPNAEPRRVYWRDAWLVPTTNTTK